MYLHSASYNNTFNSTPHNLTLSTHNCGSIATNKGAAETKLQMNEETRMCGAHCLLAQLTTQHNVPFVCVFTKGLRLVQPYLVTFPQLSQTTYPLPVTYRTLTFPVMIPQHSCHTPEYKCTAISIIFVDPGGSIVYRLGQRLLACSSCRVRIPT
jgi:hypothetical protein